MKQYSKVHYSKEAMENHKFIVKQKGAKNVYSTKRFDESKGKSYWELFYSF